MIRTNVHRRKINRYDIAVHIPQIQNLLKLPTRTKIYELILSHNGLNFTSIKFAGIQRSNSSYDLDMATPNRLTTQGNQLNKLSKS